MKVKVPNKIKIGCFTYDIVYDDTIVPDHNRCGEISPREHKIRMATYLQGDSKSQSLAHEITHFISDVYSCELDEANTDRIANGFIEFLQQLGIEFDWTNIKKV